MDMIILDPAHADRFWSKIAPAAADECWTWQGAKSAGGYAQIAIDGTTYYAHRLAYKALRAEIPAGLQLDHLCRNRACVNPWHLEPVTNRVNGVRGGLARRMTKCSRGHALTDENRHVRASGRVTCFACERRRIACPLCGCDIGARQLKRHMASHRCYENTPKERAA